MDDCICCICKPPLIWGMPPAVHSEACEEHNHELLALDRQHEALDLIEEEELGDYCGD